MRRQEMLEALRTRPFRPFRIFVSDGGTYDVRHPEMVMISPNSAIIGMPQPEQDPPAIERFSLVDLLHVTRLEPIEPTASR